MWLAADPPASPTKGRFSVSRANLPPCFSDAGLAIESQVLRDRGLLESVILSMLKAHVYFQEDIPSHLDDLYFVV